VTIEDILEEIVGEITDEYDPDAVPEVARLGDGRLRVAARLPVVDLQNLFPDRTDDYGDESDSPAATLRAVLADADVDTVGGLVAQQLGRVPLPGSEVEVAGLHLLAEGGKDARGRVRITTVLVTPPDTGPEGTGTAEPFDTTSDDAEAPDADTAATAAGHGTTDEASLVSGSERNGDVRPAGAHRGPREETDVRPG
jgi:hypothetical protein